MEGEILPMRHLGWGWNRSWILGHVCAWEEWFHPEIRKQSAKRWQHPRLCSEFTTGLACPWHTALSFWDHCGKVFKQLPLALTCSETGEGIGDKQWRQTKFVFMLDPRNYWETPWGSFSKFFMNCSNSEYKLLQLLQIGLPSSILWTSFLIIKHMVGCNLYCHYYFFFE